MVNALRPGADVGQHVRDAYGCYQLHTHTLRATSPCWNAPDGHVLIGADVDAQHVVESVGAHAVGH
jgi:hypothetical protein